MTIRLYRCSVCGKWSHAQKQPKQHKRWVREGEDGFDPDKAEPPLYDGYGSMLQPEGHGIDCGPFEPWIARPE